MNSMYWLGIGYGTVVFGLGGYLAFLHKGQKNLQKTLKDLEEHSCSSKKYTE